MEEEDSNLTQLSSSLLQGSQVKLMYLMLETAGQGSSSSANQNEQLPVYEDLSASDLPPPAIDDLPPPANYNQPPLGDEPPPPSYM
jgi:hypothetical protein